MNARAYLVCLAIGAFLVSCYQDRTIKLGDSLFCGAEKSITADGRSVYYSQGYRLGGGETKSEEEAYEGAHSARLDNNKAFGMVYEIKNVQPGQYIQASVFRKSSSKKGVLVISSSGSQATDMYLKEDIPLYYEEDGWGRLVLNATIPNGVHAISIYCYNPNETPAYFDNLSIMVHPERPADYEGRTALHIQLPDSSMRHLASLRDSAMKRGIITRKMKKYTLATAIYNEDTVPIKIRFKGDWTDHLENDKWSFRIKVARGYSINGLRSFSIQNPKTRSYMKEWVVHQLFRKEDVLTTYYDFLPVSLNGKNLGIYALEEHFDKQLVESQKRREGPILKFDEEGFWEQNLYFKETGRAVKIPYYEAALVAPFKKNRTMRSASLQSQYLIAQGMMEAYKNGGREMSELFNAEQIAWYLAICDLGKGWHGLRWHNQRFYYNPVTAELEPIGFDLYGPTPDDSPFRLSPGQVDHQNYLYFQLLNDPVIRQAYISAINEISKPDYLNEFFAQIRGQSEKLEAFFQQEYPGYKVDLEQFRVNAREISDSVKAKNKLSDNAIQYHCEKPKYNPLETNKYFKETGIKAHRERQVDGKTVIAIKNFHTAPVHVLGHSPIGARDSMILLEKKVAIPPFTNQAGEGEIEISGTVKRLFFIAENSKNKIYKTNLINWPSPKGFNPRIEMELNNPFGKSRFYNLSNGEVVFEGTHNVNQFIYIPKGFRVIFKPGTMLNFINQAGFLSYSPLFVNGTPDHPVTIRSSDQSMMGFSVFRAEEKSILQHVSFDGLNTLDYKGWELTGAVTFYDTEVEIENCTLKNSMAEDAINVIKARFTMTNCSISNSVSDGFDGDFSMGSITNCYLEQIGNDAIDLSGSQVEITNTFINACGDKGISTGEGSTVTAEKLAIENANIAIASKDNSSIILSNLDMGNADIGFAAYRKKDEFGPAQIFAEQCKHKSIRKLILVDLSSEVSVMGETHLGVKRINVDSLYPPVQ